MKSQTYTDTQTEAKLAEFESGERKKERETDRQTDGETERHRQTDRQTR